MRLFRPPGNKLSYKLSEKVTNYGKMRRLFQPPGTIGFFPWALPSSNIINIPHWQKKCSHKNTIQKYVANNCNLPGLFRPSNIINIPHWQKKCSHKNTIQDIIICHIKLVKVALWADPYCEVVLWFVLVHRLSKGEQQNYHKYLIWVLSKP